MKHWTIRISLAVIVFGLLVLAGSCNPFDPLAAAGFGDLKIYWTTNDGKIYSGDLDGQGKEVTIDVGGGSDITAFTVDRVNDKIYWSEDTGGPSDGIFRANTDGSGQETYQAGTRASSIAVDHNKGMVYFAGTSGYIYRKDIDQAGSVHRTKFTGAGVRP